MPKKSGPKGNYIKDSSGEILEGLSYYKNPKTKKSYHFINYTEKSSGRRKRQHFSRDKTIAIKQYEKWKSVQAGDEPIKEIDISDIRTPTIKTTEDGYVEWGDISEEETVVYDTYDPETGKRIVGIREDLYWKTVEKDLRYNPQKVARITGVEKVGYLDELNPKPKPLTLKKIGDVYFNRSIKPLKKNEKEDSVRWWKYFCLAIRAKTTRDVTLDAILAYQDKIYETYRQKKFKPTWIKHRFDKIKTIFNYAKKSRDVEYVEDINRILDYCKKFQYPDRSKLDPRPISKEDYLEIFNVANTKERAILLLAANSALYPQDCCDIEKRHVDLEKKTLIMDRGKTGVPRVAILWDRTIDAIHQMIEEKPNISKHLFVTYAGKPYVAHSIGGIWRKLRAKTKVGHEVKFEHIRDAAQTAAAEADCNIDEIRFLMGHRVNNITDNYLKRRPTLTKKVCEAIREYYFGDE